MLGRRSPCANCASTLGPPIRSFIPGLAQPLIAACYYRGFGRQLLKAVKFRGRRAPLEWFAQRMATCAEEMWLAPGNPPKNRPEAITWIPASLRGKRQRGFDSGEVLARSVARILGLPVYRSLYRYGHQHQVGLGRDQRLNGPNLILSSSFKEVSYLLVDDVCTTGSSMRTAVQLLGEENTIGLAVAGLTPP